MSVTKEGLDHLISEVDRVEAERKKPWDPTGLIERYREAGAFYARHAETMPTDQGKEANYAEASKYYGMARTMQMV